MENARGYKKKEQRLCFFLYFPCFIGFLNFWGSAFEHGLPNKQNRHYAVH